MLVAVSGGGGHVDPAAGHQGQPLGLQQVAELVSALVVGDLALHIISILHIIYFWFVFADIEEFMKTQEGKLKSTKFQMNSINVNEHKIKLLIHSHTMLNQWNVTL